MMGFFVGLKLVFLLIYFKDWLSNLRVKTNSNETIQFGITGKNQYGNGVALFNDI